MPGPARSDRVASVLKAEDGLEPGERFHSLPRVRDKAAKGTLGAVSLCEGPLLARQQVTAGSGESLAS